MSRIRSSLGLLGFLAATFAVGAGGLAFAPELGGGTWYERLPKAPWNPPGWAFGPAWTALYTLMAVAAWLVWRARGSLRAASFPLSLYALQLVLNGLWTLLFFGQQMVVAALVDLVALLVAIAALVKKRGSGCVMNLYPYAVTENGNEKAQAAVNKYFSPHDAAWRGIGVIPDSGMELRPEYARFDAGSGGLYEDKGTNADCRCGQVLTGALTPSQCPLFGTACTPQTPQGACMVSMEGSCYHYYLNKRG